MAHKMHNLPSGLLCLHSLQRPKERTNRLVAIKTSQKGLKNGWTRATFIIRITYLKKLKALAHWERKKVKEVVDEALGFYLKGKRINPRRDI